MKKPITMAFVLLMVAIMTITMITVGCKTTAQETTTTAAVSETTTAETTTAAETTATTAETTASQEPVEIKCLFLAGGLNQLAPLIEKKFNELNPNSNIKFVYEFADYSTLHDKIAIAETGGAGAYDIYWTITDWMPEFISAGFLMPLDSYLEKDPIDGWPDTYPQTVLNFQTVDGKLYGIPGHDGPYTLFYRTDLFNDETEKSNFKNKYGYELTPPETWDQYKDIADFFTRPDKNLYGTSFAGNDPQATPYDLVQIAHNFGAKYWEDNGYPTFNSDKWIAALEFLGKLYKEDSPKGAPQLDMLGRADMFKEGKLAMYADWIGFAGYFELQESSNVVGKVGYSLMPKGGNDGNKDSLDIYWCYAVSNSSKNKDAAWQVIKVLANPDIDKLWTIGGMGGVGVRNSTLNDPEVQKQFPFYKTIAEILNGNAFGSPYTPAASQIYDILKIAVQDYLAGSGTAKEILDAANAKIASALTK